jgi:hypothetical protein
MLFIYLNLYLYLYIYIYSDERRSDQTSPNHQTVRQPASVPIHKYKHVCYLIHVEALGQKVELVKGAL